LQRSFGELSPSLRFLPVLRTHLVERRATNYTFDCIKSWADAQRQPALPGKVALQLEDVAAAATKWAKNTALRQNHQWAEDLCR